MANSAMVKMVSEYIFSDETKKKVITALNENVDIPIIGEATEAKIMEALWETVEAAMKEVLFKED